EELRRYLRGEPVQARPPSAWERARKWVARNRAVAGGVTATVLALVLGIAGVSLALLDARRGWAKAEEEGTRAIEAERQGRAELAHTSVAAARLAAQRGQWRDALAHYDRALELGHEDDVELRLGILDCCLALY